MASDAVSTSIADNPNALETRPPWVHAVMSPHTYRGTLSRPGFHSTYLSHVTPVLEAIDASGEGLAAFIAESVYGNAGGIALPPGYLKGIYEMVRARGRGDDRRRGCRSATAGSAHHFWGFEEQGVVPDIISIAKGMGNGHPLAPVITRARLPTTSNARAISSPPPAALRSPAWSATRCSTSWRRKACRPMPGSSATISRPGWKRSASASTWSAPSMAWGSISASNFVSDRTTLAPATAETARICDRLMDFGVIMQPTGDHLNVLKIKPPMCLSLESADFFATSLPACWRKGSDPSRAHQLAGDGAGQDEGEDGENQRRGARHPMRLCRRPRAPADQRASVIQTAEAAMAARMKTPISAVFAAITLGPGKMPKAKISPLGLISVVRKTDSAVTGRTWPATCAEPRVSAPTSRERPRRPS